MLTPVDIQQKKFHIGIGFEKKDVTSFFEEVSANYEKLYRSNAELKERVNTLNDELQNYKSKESTLKKSLLLAEKDSEDTKSKATKEAKSIELEAKNKAKNILIDAETRLEEIKHEITVLETQYAAYKSNFCSLLKMQFEMLKEKDFNVDAYIDPQALVLLGGNVQPQAAPAAGGGAAFGSFTGDPQMRDESTLGGASYSSGGMSYDSGKNDLNSTSAVYTSGLGANENFVDPFSPKEDDGRYNPYDGRTATKPKTSSPSFTVSTGKGKTGYKRTQSSAKNSSHGNSHSNNNKSFSSKSTAKAETQKATTEK